MRKVFMFAALVAASTAFVGCSSDEDLSQVPEIIVEDTPEEVSTGVPFGISASFDGDQTRGVDLTAGDFNTFYLYGVKTDGTKWFDGAQFDKTAKTFDDNTTYRWSDGSTTTWREGNYNFYGVTSTSGIASPVFNQTTATFDYVVDPDNAATQEDLMVAKNLDQNSTSNDGKLGLDFYHALAGIDVSLRFNSANFTTLPTYRCKIKSITFHNIKKQGTFDFSENGTTGSGAWINQEEYADYTLTVDENSWGSNGIDEDGYFGFTDGDAYVPLTFTEGPLFVIPQEITSWGADKDHEVPLSTAITNNQSYISIECQWYEAQTGGYAYYWVCSNPAGYNLQSQRADAGYGTLYFPLKLSGGELKFNKTHHLKITLEGGLDEDGVLVNDDANFTI